LRSVRLGELMLKMIMENLGMRGKSTARPWEARRIQKG
jgi:hypothetical protein